MQEKCGNCGSDDWKLASLIHKSGTANFDMSSTGESRGAGIGGQRTQTTSQSTGSFETKLARLAAPPDRLPPPGTLSSFEDYQKTGKMSYWAATAFMLMIGFSNAKNAFIGISWGVILVIFSKPILGYFFSKEKYELKKSEHAKSVARYEESLKAYERWEKTRICMRCGTFDAGAATMEKKS